MKIQSLSCPVEKELACTITLCVSEFGIPPSRKSCWKEVVERHSPSSSSRCSWFIFCSLRGGSCVGYTGTGWDPGFGWYDAHSSFWLSWCVCVYLSHLSHLSQWWQSHRFEKKREMDRKGVNPRNDIPKQTSTIKHAIHQQDWLIKYHKIRPS